MSARMVQADPRLLYIPLSIIALVAVAYFLGWAVEAWPKRKHKRNAIEEWREQHL